MTSDTGNLPPGVTEVKVSISEITKFVSPQFPEVPEGAIGFITSASTVVGTHLAKQMIEIVEKMAGAEPLAKQAVMIAFATAMHLHLNAFSVNNAEDVALAKCIADAIYTFSYKLGEKEEAR